MKKAAKDKKMNEAMSSYDLSVREQHREQQKGMQLMLQERLV